MNYSIDLPSKIHTKSKLLNETNDFELAADLGKIKVDKDGKKSGSFISIERDSENQIESQGNSSYQFLPSNQQISFAATNSNSKRD